MRLNCLPITVFSSNVLFASLICHRFSAKIMWVDETWSFNMGDWHFHYIKQEVPQVKTKIGNLSPRVQHCQVTYRDQVFISSDECSTKRQNRNRRKIVTSATGIQITKSLFLIIGMCNKRSTINNLNLSIL